MNMLSNLEFNGWNRFPIYIKRVKLEVTSTPAKLYFQHDVFEETCQ